MQRLLAFLLVIIFINHVLSCLWIIAAKVNTEENWYKAHELKYKLEHTDEIPNSELYLLSFYFVSTTVTTVGYGDITGVNMVEKVFCVIMLFVGVMCFSFASGSLSSLITSYDSR